MCLAVCQTRAWELGEETTGVAIRVRGCTKRSGWRRLECCRGCLFAVCCCWRCKLTIGHQEVHSPIPTTPFPPTLSLTPTGRAFGRNFLDAFSTSSDNGSVRYANKCVNIGRVVWVWARAKPTSAPHGRGGERGSYCFRVHKHALTHATERRKRVRAHTTALVGTAAVTLLRLLGVQIVVFPH